MERISLKRSLDCLDGKLINYLNSNPLGMSSTEAIMLALRAYWLPMAMLAHKQNQQQIQEAAIWATSQLQAQALAIPQICGLSKQSLPSKLPNPIVLSKIETQEVALKVNSGEVVDHPDDEDDWDLNFQPTADMVAVNEALKRDLND
ncbi:hypothetical protein [Fischerella sp. PCC 9605]|uniref:hypothetical protein n=1 Tax=Fischerella sp. PCC 9605 TaxID=1173024 RepID=UPI00047E45CD|nr:hypothetical protein [Fischerella sp. PCC 9605]